MVLGEQGWWERGSLSRLDFLRYSLAGGVVVWAGSQVPAALIGEAEAQEVFGAADADPANPNRFPQSVASGDPGPDSIVLWTRVMPPKGKRDGNVKVGYRISLDDERDDTPAFLDPLLSGVAQTNRGRDFTVKVQLRRDELKPFTKYRYRFYHEGERTRTGRFMTLPSPNRTFAANESIRFAYVSCQDYTNGYYNALGALAKEDVDFVVHLGDYIYETVDEESFQGSQVRRINLPESGTPGEADTLRDYRFLYKKYKSDSQLQLAHENFAFIMVWDDHEFANDSFRVFAPDASGAFRDPERRSAANRAWAEYNPVGVPFNPNKGPLEEIVIYRQFDFGDLMTLVMTDERLYRDGPPCGLATQDRVATPGCSTTDENDPDKRGEEDPDRTMLGSRQKNQFFLPRITGSSRTWKFWGNEMMFMQFKISNTYLAGGDQVLFPDVPQADGADGVYFNLDQWDGYQAERNEITAALKEVDNFVIITGDIHTFVAGYAREDYDAPMVPNTPPPDRVGVCFVGGSVTSSNLYEIARLGQASDGPAVPEDRAAFTAASQQSNPHFVFLNSDTHGYNLMKVTQGEIVCTMRQVDTIREYQENPTAETLAQFKVLEGTSEIQRTDLPGPALPPT
jgi:alkaline phosphatase D